MKIPFFKRSPATRDEQAAALRVLKSGKYILGENVRALEKECARFLGTKHAVAVSSGTDALTIALLAMGIGPKSTVNVPVFSFIASATSAIRLGASVNFYDSSCEKSADATIHAPLFGEWFGMYRGRPANLILDLAQCFDCDMLTEYSFNFACFSFYPTKNLGGFGDGGLVAFNDPNMVSVVESLRNHGAGARHEHTRLSGNYRMDEIQAAMLRARMRRYPEISARRRDIASLYHDLLGGRIPYAPWFFVNETPNQYCIRIYPRLRDELRAYLRRRGIGTEVYYPKLIIEQACVAGRNLPKPEDFPAALERCRSIVALPLYPELTDAEVRYIADAVVRFFRKR